MKTADTTTINHSLNRDDVVNFVPLRAVAIDGLESILVNPRRGAESHVLAAEVKSRRIIRVVRPSLAPRLVNGLLASIVSGLFLSCDAFAVGSVRPVAIEPPCVLGRNISADVLRGACLVVGSGADFAPEADAGKFRVVIGAGFTDSATRTDLERERNRTFHNSDIIASSGDVKPDELGEHREPATPSQAAAGLISAKGVTTRQVSPNNNPVHEPPGALTGIRHSLSYAGTHRSADKEPRDNTLTTIENRSRDLADNWENNNALLRKFRAKGNVKPFSGGNLILQEIGYTDASTINANSYSGYEIISIAPNSPISSAQFSIKQYAGSVSMSGLEMLQNSGKEAFIDLMEGRMQIGEGQLLNRMDYDMYQDGTGNASKDITGLALAVPDDPTTGTYGGIPRGTWSFWRSQYYRGVTDGGAAVSAANIQAYMTTLALRCVRGNNKPDLWIGDATYFGFYVNSLQAIQRVQSMSGEGKAGAGFGPELAFYGGGMAATVVMGGGISGAVSSTQTTSGATSAHMWALNTDFLFWRPHRDRNFVPIGGERQSVNQDAVVKLFGVAGNMTSNGPQFSGVLVA